MKKYILISLLVIFVIPSIALASWWNPISWFNNWSFKKVPTTPQGQINTQQNSDNKINELQKQVEELKKQQPILNSKNIVTPEANNKEQVNNATTQSSNIVKKEEQPNVETIIKKEENQNVKELIKAKETINYDSIVNFNSITEEKNLEYTSKVSNITGVPAKLLLYILKNNKSSTKCFVKDLKTRTLSNGKIMNTGWLSSFSSIVSTLKLDPYKTAVSCEGEIGVIFIPQSWMSLSNRIIPEYIKIDSMLNPWRAEDIVMELGLYLGEVGGSYKNGLLLGSFDIKKLNCDLRSSMCYGY